MNADADLASVAALIADPHRAAILLTLLGGTPQSGSGLAEAVGISRSLASAHLKKLVAGHLVRAERSGRQQMYSIASDPVAEALELLILLAPRKQVRSLSDATRSRSLRWARMCYDHLAGMVGVAVTDALVGHDLIADHEGGYALGLRSAELVDLGINVDTLERRTWLLVRPCLDWTEHRYHLGGSLGTALANEMMRRRWIITREASRIVTVTQDGEAGLRSWLGIDLPRLRAAA